MGLVEQNAAGQSVPVPFPSAALGVVRTWMQRELHERQDNVSSPKETQQHAALDDADVRLIRGAVQNYVSVSTIGVS